MQSKYSVSANTVNNLSFNRTSELLVSSKIMVLSLVSNYNIKADYFNLCFRFEVRFNIFTILYNATSYTNAQSALYPQ